MTSVATIAGAIPVALALGPGAESRNPMAIAVIGGVVFSTVLTLYVVPCFYSVMSRFEEGISMRNFWQMPWKKRDRGAIEQAF